MHLSFTALGCYLGYLAHRYEENSEERVKKLLEKYPRAPVQWAAMVTEPKGEGFAILGLTRDNSRHFSSSGDEQ